MATYIVSLILVVIVAAIIRKMYKDHKSGKGGCGCGGCTNCSHKGSCHQRWRKNSMCRNNNFRYILFFCKGGNIPPSKTYFIKN